MTPSANLSLLWANLPYIDRFDAAAAAGFTAVEVLAPYYMPAKETQNALRRCGLRLTLMNAPPPSYTGAPEGYAAIVDGKDRFQYDMRRSFRYVEALNVSFLHVMSGKATGASALAAMIDNLRWATKAAPKGLTLTIEPLCTEAKPGYFLNDYALAADIIASVNADNLGLQFDSYHAQMLHGDAVKVFQDYAPLIRHIQIGDTPTRSAPGTGDVNFSALFEEIRASGYDGYIAGEYHPGGPTEDTLDWMQFS
ncbi:hydroxypyruvate isomerase [Sulfitobacter sp. SK012]|uniref:hydroxypyruvate isomerase family protein n=1 Tax=Sulfitobacter sp. SK012 TaxID=1389005 RepID=UPI000E0AB1E1|nr:TIM barrel protein [Sulfitobacter sp. SK012]AXI48692.1 hydroxypyruvate isomerase [Sulfitobacter sp. SK012]